MNCNLQQHQRKSLSIGDYCEVLGKIKPMTAVTKCTCSYLGNDVRFGCIREIRDLSVCTMNHSTNTNGEILHWVKCLNFTQDVQENKVKRNASISGCWITQFIMNSDCVKCFESGLSSYNCLERKCCQTPQFFRNAMLYSHCEATLKTLDPSFRYVSWWIGHDTTLPSTEDCIGLIGGELNSSKSSFSSLIIYIWVNIQRWTIGTHCKRGG